MNGIMKRIALILVILVSLVGCSNKKEEVGEDVSNLIKIERGEDDLIIWSHYDIKEDILAEFEEKNPGVNVIVKVFPFKSYEKTYLEALSLGDVPDVMVIDSTNLGSFNTLDALEDLSKEPYTASKYKDDFDRDLWELGLSFDRERLIGLAVASAPIVTYYRADILESYGFPSEPEELGRFMEDPDNWLKIGEAFKEDNRYLCQWAADPVSIMNYSIGYFDEELNYIKNENGRFEESIEIARKARDNGYVAFKDIWTEEGEALIRQDKLPMLYLGSWGADQIKAWAPEQSGKWRVTRLPFNIYGWNNSTLFSIPKKAVMKDAAWKFIEYYTFEKKQDDIVGSIPSYLPFRNNQKALEHTNEFLGGQKDQIIYENVLNNTEEYPVTSIDKAAYEIWVDKVNRGLQEELDSKKIIKNIEEEINKSLKNEKKILLENK